MPIVHTNAFPPGTSVFFSLGLVFSRWWVFLRPKCVVWLRRLRIFLCATLVRAIAHTLHPIHQHLLATDEQAETAANIQALDDIRSELMNTAKSMQESLASIGDETKKGALETDRLLCCFINQSVVPHAR